MRLVGVVERIGSERFAHFDTHTARPSVVPQVGLGRNLQVGVARVVGDFPVQERPVVPYPASASGHADVRADPVVQPASDRRFGNEVPEPHRLVEPAHARARLMKIVVVGTEQSLVALLERVCDGALV